MTADCVNHAVLDSNVKYIFRFHFQPKMAGLFRFCLFSGQKRYDFLALYFTAEKVKSFSVGFYLEPIPAVNC